jgi:hypothetical protein
MANRKNSATKPIDLGHQGYIVMIPFAKDSPFKDKAPGWPDWAIDNKMWYSPDYYRHGAPSYAIDSGKWQSPDSLKQSGAGFRGTICAYIGRAMRVMDFANGFEATVAERVRYSHPDRALMWGKAAVHPLNLVLIPTEITDQERRLRSINDKKSIHGVAKLALDFAVAAHKQDPGGLFYAWVPLCKKPDGSFELLESIENGGMEFLTPVRWHALERLERYPQATHLGALLVKPGQALTPEQTSELIHTEIKSRADKTPKTLRPS